MDTIYRLEKEDVKAIIAEHFNVPLNDVDVICFTDCEGYGMGERYVPNFKVEVIERNE